MNKSTEFYNKLLKHIVFIFCFLFLIFINILRFYQLQTEEKQLVHPTISKPSYSSFVLFQDKDKTPMFFLENKDNAIYFQTIFKEINPKVFHVASLINCSENNISSFEKALKSEFPHLRIIPENCDIDTQKLQKLYDQNTLIIAIFENEDLSHQKALRFAYQNKLKPKLKIVEIKNDI